MSDTKDTQIEHDGSLFRNQPRQGEVLYQTT